MIDLQHHEHEDGTLGAILSASCNGCGCGYSYCDGCEGVDEVDEPEDGCQNLQCGCHADGRHEL